MGGEKCPQHVCIIQPPAIVIPNQETEKPRQVITKTAGGKRREGPGAMGRELMVSAVQDREGSLKGRQQQQPAYSEPFIHISRAKAGLHY